MSTAAVLYAMKEKVESNAAAEERNAAELLTAALDVITLLVAAVLVDVLDAAVLTVDEEVVEEAQYWPLVKDCTRPAAQDAASSE